MGSIDSNKLDW